MNIHEAILNGLSRAQKRPSFKNGRLARVGFKELLTVDFIMVIRFRSSYYLFSFPTLQLNK